MLSNAQSNLENEFICNAIRLDSGSARINYGFNSGGYEAYQYFVTSDGGVLAISTVINEFHKVNFNDPDSPEWFIVGCEVNYEDPDLIDDHTGENVPCAYED